MAMLSVSLDPRRKGIECVYAILNEKVSTPIPLAVSSHCHYNLYDSVRNCSQLRDGFHPVGHESKTPINENTKEMEYITIQTLYSIIIQGNPDSNIMFHLYADANFGIITKDPC